MAMNWNRLVFLVGLVSVVCGQSPNNGPSCSIPSFGLDGYLLTLQWPIAFCAKQGVCSLDRPRHEWIIHGLWPQWNATNSALAAQLTGSPFPQYCCHPQQQNVDFAQLSPDLGEQMIRVWPSLKAPRRTPMGEMFTFWRHEWTKHGTCALQPRSHTPFSVEHYLSTTLALYRRFSLNRWLTAARIRPSNQRPYSVTQVHTALEHGSRLNDSDTPASETGLEGVFRLQCDRPPPQMDSTDAPAILSEVQICLDTHLRPTNCAHLFGPDSESGASDDHQCGRQVMLLQF